MRRGWLACAAFFIFKTFYFTLQNLSLAAELRGFLRINWIKVGTLNLWSRRARTFVRDLFSRDFHRKHAECTTSAQVSPNLRPLFASSWCTVLDRARIGGGRGTSTQFILYFVFRSPSLIIEIERS
jgi:hypothetical protein